MSQALEMKADISVNCGRYEQRRRIDITGLSHTALRYGRLCWLWNFIRARDMD